MTTARKKQISSALDEIGNAASQVAAAYARAVLTPGRKRAVFRRAICDVFPELGKASTDSYVEDEVERWCLLMPVVAGERTRFRPDVLAFVRNVLTVPAWPHTGVLVEHAIICRLRDRYGIESTVECGQKFASAWDDLSAGFRKKRRRIRVGWSPQAHMLLDVACMSGDIRRALPHAAALAYYSGFIGAELGVDERRRNYGTGEGAAVGEPGKIYLPELFLPAAQSLPPLSAYLRKIFGVPMGIPGLDEVFDRLMPNLSQGLSAAPGVVTLLCGSPGTGKSTLGIVIAKSLAQLGARVRFVTAEESAPTLQSKLLSLSAPFLTNTWTHRDGRFRDLHGDFEIQEAISPRTFFDIVNRVRFDLASKQPEMTFLFLDSMGALLRDRRGSGTRRTVEALRESLARLRETGAHVFLTASEEDEKELQLDYLVDNVVRLGHELDDSRRHATRTITLEKTRLQYCHRGRHVLHLSDTDGAWVSPSLHSLVRTTRAPVSPGAEVVPVAVGLAIRSGAQILLYGKGSAGKAAIALVLATAASRRTLVVSFLYGEDYYHGIWKSISRGSVIDLVDVWALYPGFIDAETFLSTIRTKLETAELEGHPFRSVVIDGIHNLLLEFPLLQSDSLLWPTLFRLLRSKGATAISTFTFFGRTSNEEPSATKIDERAALFSHMLVSASNITMTVDSPQGDPGGVATPRHRDRGRRLEVIVQTSNIPELPMGTRLAWDKVKSVLSLHSGSRQRAGLFRASADDASRPPALLPPPRLPAVRRVD